MNNLKKIGLTALGTSLIATSAFAGSMAVTGSAGISMSNSSNASSGNSFGMTDSLTFSGSGEMDNGWNVTVSMEIENNAQDSAATTNNMDSRSVKIDMGDMGVLTFSGHGGSSAMSAIDDVTPTAYGEAWDVIGSSTTAPAVGQATKFTSVAGGATNNSFFYSAPEMVAGLGVNLSYTPSGTGRPDGTLSYALKYTGIEGLTIGYGQDDNGLSGSSNIEHETAYATYAYGPITVGIQEGESDQEASTAGDDDMSSAGITYAVTDDLTIGYNVSEYSAGDKTVDQESENVSFSYTTGGITIAGAMVEMNNVGGSTSARDDVDGYAIDVSFAF